MTKQYVFWTAMGSVNLTTNPFAQHFCTTINHGYVFFTLSCIVAAILRCMAVEETSLRISLLWTCTRRCNKSNSDSDSDAICMGPCPKQCRFYSTVHWIILVSAHAWCSADVYCVIQEKGKRRVCTFSPGGPIGPWGPGRPCNMKTNKEVYEKLFP